VLLMVLLLLLLLLVAGEGPMQPSPPSPPLLLLLILPPLLAWLPWLLVSGWMDGLLGGWMDGWMDESTNARRGKEEKLPACLSKKEGPYMKRKGVVRDNRVPIGLRSGSDRQGNK
jgi:hypothetical protein